MSYSEYSYTVVHLEVQQLHIHTKSTLGLRLINCTTIWLCTECMMFCAAVLHDSNDYWLISLSLIQIQELVSRVVWYAKFPLKKHQFCSHLGEGGRIEPPPHKKTWIRPYLQSLIPRLLLSKSHDHPWINLSVYRILNYLLSEKEKITKLLLLKTSHHVTELDGTLKTLMHRIGLLHSHITLLQSHSFTVHE